MRLALLAALITAPLALGCGASVKCDHAVLNENVIPALDKMEAAKRSDWALEALGKSCTQPKGLAKTYADWAIVPDDARDRTTAQAIMDHKSLWKKACAGGMDVFEALAMASAEERPGLLYTRCGLERLGYPQEAWGARNAVAAILFQPVIDASGANDATKKRLRDGLMGK